ncbi:MAG TPA: putative sugar nucleotidyl transferase, partial [Gemmatimonadales bacterium]|nr:putative sugar nucleotidyl transferase [Gemmatimonadales bacterium]
MTSLYLLEPESPGVEWAPFAGVRPIAELRAGVWRIRERWEAAAGVDATALLGGHVAGFVEGDEPATRPEADIVGPALVAASWFAPTGVPIAPAPGVRRLVNGRESVGWLLAKGERWEGPHDQGPA